MAEADRSSPVPPHTEHETVGIGGRATEPLPPQVVHVNVLTAPVPRQWAQPTAGDPTRTVPRPPHTQQVDREDMTSKGSLP